MTDNNPKRRSITLVTAYFTLPTTRDYHAWMANLLPFVQSCLIREIRLHSALRLPAGKIFRAIFPTAGR